MPFYKVTLKRSPIGMGELVQKRVKALGFGRKHRTTYLPITGAIASQIALVKELVDVEVTDEYLTKAEIRESRKPNPGFSVEREAAEETK